MTEEMTTVDFSRETNEVVTQLSGIREDLRGVRDAVTPTPETLFELVQNRASTSHMKRRCISFTFTCSGAATLTLTVGTQAFTFILAGADTRTVPLPIVIDRGVSVTLAATAGLCYGYLTGTTE